MNYQLLNKKWSSFYNWTILYPSLIMLLFIGGFAWAIFNSNMHLEYIEGLFFGAYFIIIALVVLLVPYTIWFIVASDSLAKTLGWNRIFFNILNILAVFSFLYFITIILFWIKVKDVFEEGGLNTTWSGKLK